MGSYGYACGSDVWHKWQLVSRRAVKMTVAKLDGKWGAAGKWSRSWRCTNILRSTHNM